MSDQGRPDWDPWGRSAPTDEQPVAAPQPTASSAPAWAAPADGATEPLPQAGPHPTPSSGSSAPSDPGWPASGRPDPGWSDQGWSDTGWSGYGASAGTHPSYSAPHAYATPQPGVSGGSSPTVPPPARRGPGWGALLATVGLAAVLAGGTGGAIGGYLGSHGYLQAPGATADNGPTPTPGAAVSTRPEGSVASIAAQTMPSVVTLQVESGSSQSSGSGWVLDQLGHLVTNNHVIADAADGNGSVTVVLSNGKHLEATIIGRDAAYDLAVVKVDRTDLTPLAIGDSDEVVVGDPVIAVGSPLGLDSSVTTGIVSALNRPVSAGDSSTDRSFINAIQTDAAINPGNSGGPLLNSRGEVIGVNSAIATLPSLGGQAGSIGVGFAIPSNQVAKTVDQLIKSGKAQHPIIGVYLDEAYDGEGVRIGDDQTDAPAVDPAGPAGQAGLMAGDIIVAFNGRPVTDNESLIVAIRAQDVGDTVTLTVRRDGTDEDIPVVLGEAGG